MTFSNGSATVPFSSFTLLDDNPGGGTGSGTEDDSFALTAGTWKAGSVPTKSSEVWYSFSVISGNMYHIWWNDKGAGDGTKTGDIVLFAKYSGGTTVIFVFEDNGWSTPKSFTASTSGTVKINVMEWSGTGTFAIAYSTGTTRPGSSGGDGLYTQGWPPNNVLSEFGIGGLTMPPGTTEAEWFQTSYASEKGLVIQATTTTGFSYFESYFESNRWMLSMEQTLPTFTLKRWLKAWQLQALEAVCSKNSSDNKLTLTVNIK